MSAAGPRQQDAPWWAALPPVSVRVPCGSGTHQLRWEQGRLIAADHPDAEAELVLAALGGDRAECIELTEAWGARSDDLEVLAVGPRSDADELTVTRDEIDRLRLSGQGWLARGQNRMMPGQGGAVFRSAGGTALIGPGNAGFSLLAYARGLLGGQHRRIARAAAIRRQATSGGYVRAGQRLVSSAGQGPSSSAGQHPPSGAGQRRASGAASAAASSFTVLSYFAAGTNPADREFERARARQAELLALLTLGPELALRLTATVAAAWADGGSRAGDGATHRPALVAALAGRLAPAAAAWLGIGPDQVEVTLHEDPQYKDPQYKDPQHSGALHFGAGWGELAMTGSGSDRKLRAALPAAWLASVWAAGLAVVGGHLIVAVREAAWPEVTVLGVREPGADPVILKVRATPRGWVESTGVSESSVGGPDGRQHSDGGAISGDEGS